MTYSQQLDEQIAAARETLAQERQDVTRLRNQRGRIDERLETLRALRQAALDSGNTARARMLAQKITSQRAHLADVREQLGVEREDIGSARSALNELLEDRSTYTDFASEASLLLSYMPAGALTLFADYYAEYAGDINLALAAFRQDPQYDQWFPGNRDPSGLLLLSEREYIDTVAGYRLTLAQYGINPNIFDQRIPELISGRVSVDEFENRVSLYYNQLQQNIAGVRQWYATQYGLADLTDESLLAAMLDPQMSSDILQRQVSAATIGGEALARGFSVGEPLVSRLLTVGYGQQQAANLFAQASMFVPRLGGASLRALTGAFGIGEYVGAAALGEAAPSQLIQRLTARESSLFSDQGKVAGYETGALRGIREE